MIEPTEPAKPETKEPAWMEAVHERDRLFGQPLTKYEDTATWGGIVIMCPKVPALHAVYRVPAFLEAEATAYAKLDGWHETSAGMICPACAQKAGAQ